MPPPAVTELCRGDDLVVGEFRCAPGDPRWRVENDIGERFHIVFPWVPVGIARAYRPPTVATPNHAVLYTAGQRFRRTPLWSRGDHCLFLAVADAPPEWAGDPVIGPELWLAQRLFAEHLRDPAHDPGRAARIARRLAAGLLRADAPVAPATRAGPVERTKARVAGEPDAPISAARLARHAGYSAFHLPRVFRHATGYTLHAFGQQLRLRLSVALLLDGRFTAGQAGDRFGFPSQSHFTERFRRAFGVTPARVRTARAHAAGLAALIDALLDRAGSR
jgi:AraC-like DNA-binding protein